MPQPDDQPSAACRACGATGNRKWYDVREMQLGMRERFRYYQCAACGSLQIGRVPADLSRFYSQDYFSFSLRDRAPGLFSSLRGIRNRSLLTGRGSLGRLLAAVTYYPFAEVGRWLVSRGAAFDSRILDVGCGAGQLLCDLAAAGYRNLVGVDPFLESDARYENGVRVLRRSIHEMEGSYDFILFVHSFEHVTDPAETLASAARLLAPGGLCVVWSPTVPCHAWDEYGENWVQIDAPRHVLIPSPQAMQFLGERARLRLCATEYNSNEFQFVASEFYRRDVPLAEQRGAFPRVKARFYRRRAEQLNAQRRGDQAAFFFTRP